jgi:hypothetical protein
VLELPGINSKGESVNSWADWRYDSLNVYVGMRLLWDMSQDVDKIINEYCAGLYGPAAPLTKKFYDEMEIAFADPNTKNGPDFRWDWESCWVKTYPPAFVAKMMGYLREAVKITEGQEPFHTRAQQLLEGFLPFEENSAMFSKAGAKLERSLTVPSVDKAPVIDGALSDECWKNAAVSEDFCDSFGLYKLKSKTDMRLLHDNDNLYIGVTASFPKGAPLKTDVPANSRDGFIYDDESCEVFLTQDNKLYQFIIGPDNILFDLFNPDAKKPLKEEAVKWNCKGVVYKTVRGDGEWTAELAIPLKSLGLKTPSKENPWRVNFCRNHFYKKDGEKTFQQELSTWSPTHGSFHNTDKFGSLIFK